MLSTIGNIKPTHNCWVSFLNPAHELRFKSMRFAIGVGVVLLRRTALTASYIR